MKQRSTWIITVSLLAAAASIVSAGEPGGETLFKSKCASCHLLSKPKDMSTMVAPMAQGIMFHMKESFVTREKIKAHIDDFVLNPTAEKAICRSVRRFGLMPSLKGTVSPTELDIISDWMVEHLLMDKEEHQQMEKEQHKEKEQQEGEGCQKS